jgi:chromatin remodeling complex protein RSC6
MHPLARLRPAVVCKRTSLLHEPNDKRTIHADAKPKAVFGKDSVGMFEIAGLIGPHLS